MFSPRVFSVLLFSAVTSTDRWPKIFAVTMLTLKQWMLRSEVLTLYRSFLRSTKGLQGKDKRQHYSPPSHFFLLRCINVREKFGLWSASHHVRVDAVGDD